MRVASIANRIMQMLAVLLGISFVTFFLTYLAPGDPATAMYEAAGIVPTEEQLETARNAMGLNKPFVVQYVSWIGNCIQGDFGESFSRHQPVHILLKERIAPTIKLSVFSMMVMLVVSVPLGILSAIHQDKLVDYTIRGLNFMGISMPGFWVALMLQYFFSVKLKILPVVSSGDNFEKMILPVITLAIAMSAKYTRQVRTAVLEELNQEYVIGAKARGLDSWMILWKHVLPNAMLPLVTLLGLSLGSLLGGTAIVEVIFSYPGLGHLAVKAVSERDYPLIQGFVLWIALIYMLINLFVDISYRFLNPRSRKGA